MVKLCKFCSKEKDINNFISNKCKQCYSAYQKEYKAKNKEKIKNYNKQYVENNKDKIKKNNKNYYDSNKEKIKQNSSKFYYNNKHKIKQYYILYLRKNKDKIREHNKIYYKNNKQTKINYYFKHKDKIKNYHKKYNKNRSKIDINFKLRRNIARLILLHLKKHNLKKTKSTFYYMTYTIEELKTHLEKMFEPWMSWENQGIYKLSKWNDNDPSTWTWQIDHIIPQSSFDFTDEEQIKKCWSLENLRPLSSKENLLKGNR
jgi:hypothetical protein